MCDEVLFKASMPDGDIRAYDEGNWEPEDNCLYLNFDDKAIVRVYPLTAITADVHVHLKSEFWGSGVSNQLQEAIEDYLVNQTNYCKIVLQTPQCCRSVLQAAVRNEFKLEGILTSAICWRGKIENIVLMSKSIRSNTRG
jgi:hypothetical protein